LDNGVNKEIYPKITPKVPNIRGKCGGVNIGTVWMIGVNIYPKENDLPLLIFTPWGVWMEG
jgi:hypothetical protein